MCYILTALSSIETIIRIMYSKYDTSFIVICFRFGCYICPCLGCSSFRSLFPRPIFYIIII